MSQEDSLTLGARIKDEFSGPVREMGKAWKEFSDKLKHGHEEGVKHAKLHGKEVEGLAEKFKGMRRELMEGIGPALEELGIGLIGVRWPDRCGRCRDRRGRHCSKIRSREFQRLQRCFDPRRHVG